MNRKKITINLTNYDYAGRFDVTDDEGDEVRDRAGEYLAELGYNVALTATGLNDEIEYDQTEYEFGIDEKINNDIEQAYISAREAE